MACAFVHVVDEDDENKDVRASDLTPELKEAIGDYKLYEHDHNDRSSRRRRARECIQISWGPQLGTLCQAPRHTKAKRASCNSVTSCCSADIPAVAYWLTCCWTLSLAASPGLSASLCLRVSRAKGSGASGVASNCSLQSFRFCDGAALP
ncbi:hypothetical protein RI054_26g109750 [Pseudoscourfieldia marina]